jgi:hypothetical protein
MMFGKIMRSFSAPLIPLLLAILLAGAMVVGAVSISGQGWSKINVNVRDSKGSVLSGVAVEIINGTSKLASATTNSTGWATISLTTDKNASAVIITTGPISWQKLDIVLNNTVEAKFWLNDTSKWGRVNVTVYAGAQSITVKANMTFKTSSLEASRTDLSIPRDVYVPKTESGAAESGAVVTVKIPEKASVMLMKVGLKNVTITFTNGTVRYTNNTQIPIDVNVASVKIEYESPGYILGLPLQTWIVIGVVAVIASIMVIAVRRGKKAVEAVLKPSRRAIRRYEYSNGYVDNGLIFEVLEGSDVDEKHRLARRVLRRA